MNLQPFLPKLPKYLIKTTIFPYHIEEIAIYFKVTYTVFGEMISVENDFSLLPAAAQKMMLGKNYEDIIVNINGHAALFKYKIPLAVFGYHKEGIWKTIFEETNAITKQELDWYIATAPLYYKDNWVMELWRKYTNNPKSKDFDLHDDYLFYKGEVIGLFFQNEELINYTDEITVTLRNIEEKFVPVRDAENPRKVTKEHKFYCHYAQTRNYTLETNKVGLVFELPSTNCFTTDNERKNPKYWEIAIKNEACGFHHRFIIDVLDNVADKMTE